MWICGECTRSTVYEPGLRRRSGCAGVQVWWAAAAAKVLSCRKKRHRPMWWDWPGCFLLLVRRPAEASLFRGSVDFPASEGNSLGSLGVTTDAEARKDWSFSTTGCRVYVTGRKTAGNKWLTRVSEGTSRSVACKCHATKPVRDDDDRYLRKRERCRKSAYGDALQRRAI